MTEGNKIDVTLIKSKVLIDRGMGLTLPQLALKYGLSNAQMKMALIDMGALKSDDSEERATELTAREMKFIDVCAKFGIEPSTGTEFIEELGLEYKTGRRGSAGGRKYIIVDDTIDSTSPKNADEAEELETA